MGSQRLSLITCAVCVNTYFTQSYTFVSHTSCTHTAVNVLVFNNGLTVKLADFGTAVQLSEIAAVGGKITGCTPFFASPEVRNSFQHS